MAWTDLTFPFGSLLSSAKMTQLDANLDAIAAQESGTPVIKANISIYNVASSDTTTFASLSFLDIVSCPIFVPTGANTMVIMNRHKWPTTTGSNYTLSRIVTSGSAIASTVTTLAYAVMPFEAFGTAYMDVSTIRGSNEIIKLQGAGVGGGGFFQMFNSTIYFI